MKRLFTLLLSAVALSALIGGSASASNYDSVAQELSAIGIFRGTASGGFDLDRAPTRSEAAIMLVRLYGAEEQAKTAYAAGTIRHPFTDVGGTAAPSVAWLYTNGIANGTSATTFGAANPCTVQNYAVFLLRALGYQDKTDFQYADALDFAQKCGFYNEVLFSGTFLRDDLAALTYQALAANTKGTETSLLESLIASGGIDASAAGAIRSKIGGYRALLKAANTQEMLSADVDLGMKMGLSLQADGENLDISMDLSGNAKAILDGSPQMAVRLKGSIKGIESTATDMAMEAWLKDDVVYTNTTVNGENAKIKQPAGMSSVLDTVDLMQMATGMNVSGLALIKSVTVQDTAAGTTYAVAIDAQKLLGLVNDLLKSIGLEDLKSLGVTLDMGDITAHYTVSGGSLKGCDMTFRASAQMIVPAAGDTPAQRVSIALNYTADMTVKATGSAVTITYPDFSGYQESDALMGGLTG